MQPQPDVKLSASKLAMWRSLIALAYADGSLADSEKAMLVDYLKANHIDPAQHATLDADIAKGVTLKDVYPGITEVHDRACLLNMGRVLFYKDGDFSAAEQAVYDAIHADQERAVDFHKVEAKAHEMDEVTEFSLIREKLDENAHEGVILRLMHYISNVMDWITGDED